MLMAFLQELMRYNSVIELHQHKQEKRQAVQACIAVIHQLQAAAGIWEPKALETPVDKLIFRLNRDTRFSHEKGSIPLLLKHT